MQNGAGTCRRDRRLLTRDLDRETAVDFDPEESHRTCLADDGNRKPDTPKQKMMLGSPAGGVAIPMQLRDDGVLGDWRKSGNQSRNAKFLWRRARQNAAANGKLPLTD